jgi:hypothetical protein
VGVALGVWVFTPSHSLTLSYTLGNNVMWLPGFLLARNLAMPLPWLPGFLPLGPQPCNAFAFTPGLPSSWLATLQCLCLDSRASFLLARNLAMPLLWLPNFLPLGPQPCNPFALVASPKLGLRQTMYLGSWGLVAQIIASKFLQGGRPFLLGAIGANISSPLPFQTHRMWAYDLLPWIN